MDIFYDLPDLNRIFPAIRLSVSARFVFISASTVSSNVLLNFFILLPHRDIVNYFFRLIFFRSSHPIANFCILTTVDFFRQLFSSRCSSSSDFSGARARVNQNSTPSS